MANEVADSDDYLSRVGAYVLARRGKGAFLSPADVEIIEDWRNAGVPAGAVIRGVDAAIRQSGGFRSLAQCRWAVEKEARRSRGEAGTVAAADEDPRPVLAALAAALTAAAGRGGTEDTTLIAEAARAVAALAPASREEARRALGNIERSLFAALAARMTAEERTALAAKTALALEGRQADARTFSRTRRALLMLELRNKFGIPPLRI